jgi:TonB family protein
MTVSLVGGLPGGAKTPSPVFSPQEAPAQRQPTPVSAPPREAPAAEAVPIPVPEAAPSKPEPPKPVPKPAPQPAPPKPEPPKPEPPKRDPAAEALAKLRAAAKPPATPGVITEALKVAKESSGGGEVAGKAGGGIEDIYGAQIVMAVQPNWRWPAMARGDLSVSLYLKIDATGRVLDVRVAASSGNPLFDSSAEDAVRRTQALPPPPSPAYNEIVLPFYQMR